MTKENEASGSSYTEQVIIITLSESLLNSFSYIYFTYSAMVRLFILYPFNGMSPDLYPIWYKAGDETKIYTC